MATLAVPPYDVIVWMAVFGFSAIISFIIACCCCRRGPAGYKPPGALYQVLRGLRIIIITFVAGFLTMLVVMGLLAAVGVESLLLVPTSNATCGTTALCPTHTQDGIDGWTDQSCCSYEQGASTYPYRRDVWLRTSESHLLVHGWILANGTLAEPSQPRLNILYNHGSGGNIGMGYRHVRYEELLSRGNVAVFTYDYPGYGRSQPDSVTPGAANVMEGASAAATWFATTWVPTWDLTSSSSYGTEAAPVDVPAVPTGGIDMSDIVLQGRSLGGWVSTWLGANVADWRVRGLVLQSTLASFGELWEAYFPAGGWVLHAHVLGAQPEFNSPRFIAGIGGCLYQYHSRDDEWAPFAHGKQTFDAAAHKAPSCSDFVEVSGATHTQPLLPRGTTTLRAWLEAVRRQAPSTRSAATPEATTGGEVIAGPLAGTLVAVVVACVLAVVIGMIMERLLIEDDGDGDDMGNDGGDDEINNNTSNESAA